MKGRNSSHGDDDPDPAKLLTGSRDIGPQAVLSLVLGLTAFFSFCVGAISAWAL